MLNSLNVSSPAPQADLQVAGGEDLRHRCRNPKCRAKLPAPVSNACEAFCSPGCHANFFRTRCRVCEESIEQPPRGGVRIGWLMSDAWYGGVLIDVGPEKYDVSAEHLAYGGRLSGWNDGGHLHCSDVKEINEKWIRACNLTRWERAPAT